jgi:hypothetical protein
MFLTARLVVGCEAGGKPDKVAGMFGVGAVSGSAGGMAGVWLPSIVSFPTGIFLSVAGWLHRRQPRKALMVVKRLLAEEGLLEQVGDFEKLLTT